jgi:uncharacterized protein with GYD domain
MNKYILLINWTEYGIKNIKESPSRFDEAKTLLESMGGQVKGLYLTSGDFDLILIAEMPSDALAKFVLTVAQRGAIRTKTIRAWNENEYRAIIASL